MAVTPNSVIFPQTPKLFVGYTTGSFVYFVGTVGRGAQGEILTGIVNSNTSAAIYGIEQELYYNQGTYWFPLGYQYNVQYQGYIGAASFNMLQQPAWDYLPKDGRGQRYLPIEPADRLDAELWPDTGNTVIYLTFGGAL
jgi:hypothetical protein